MPDACASGKRGSIIQEPEHLGVCEQCAGNRSVLSDGQPNVLNHGAKEIRTCFFFFLISFFCVRVCMCVCLRVSACLPVLECVCVCVWAHT